MGDIVVDQVNAAAAAPAPAPAQHRYRSAAPYIVGRETIREFACAVLDCHPAHWSEDAAAALGFDGLIAPATFAAIILQRVHREILDTLITGCDSARILHADQVFDFGRPLMAGDRLSCDISVESFRTFAAYNVLAIKSVLIDRYGAVVQTGNTALLARTGGADPSRAEMVRKLAVHGYRPAEPERLPDVVTAVNSDRITPASGSRTPCTTVDFDALTVGAELPVLAFDLSRGDLVNYAGVTGDGNPALLNEQVPTAAGLPTVVAPRMLTLGLAASFLSAWLGDPAAVTRFRAQFAHHTHYVGIPALDTSSIEFRGRVTSLDPLERKAAIAIDARSDGRKLFGYAAAEVRFPERDRAEEPSPVSRARRRCESSRAARS
ncbi:fused (3R)-hydroxyacyl-ACP dehydratase subunits HadA/HadB [Nocardia sp. NPDC057440]|uniref:fused (3R)-hydroxyacyl-ACP dehydratase subunits HadA/HadB n=1 Tax=Nocardia sp. NPDC057440 TaxID=3346134 RepID=UPI003672BDC3